MYNKLSEEQKMKYRVSAYERWSFGEDYYLKKDDMTLCLELTCKWGSVIVDVKEGHDFGEEFYSTDYENYEIEDTGDESLDGYFIVSDNMSEEEADTAVDKLYEQFEEANDDYFDFRDYLECNGWEYSHHEVNIPDIEVESLADVEPV